MATNAAIAAKLLRGAATFFRTLGEQNPAIQEQMATNAQTFEVVAEQVESDPMGEAFNEGEEPGNTP